MIAFVLVLTLFFWPSVESPPAAAAKAFPSADLCLSELAADKALAEARSDVSYATGACFEVDQGSKAKT